MIANYHTHTYRCHHAYGTEREYIETAIAGGLKILGFSDHTPQFYPKGFVDRDKMLPEELPEYCDTILALKKEYASDIEIHLGLEVEYYPAFWDRLLTYVQDFPIEYFLLGQHHLGNEVDDLNSFAPCRDPKGLSRYVDQCIEALSTGAFTYAAHPDLFHFIGDDAFYRREMRRLCVFARAHHIPLEINFNGLAGNRNYPDPRFWEIAGEVGNQAVLGCDAHVKEMVWRPDLEKRALQLAKASHVEVLETVPLIRPKKNS
ncbi:MAG: histidinol-phosphatase [Lachnospiraceae bacterium]